MPCCNLMASAISYKDLLVQKIRKRTTTTSRSWTGTASRSWTGTDSCNSTENGSSASYNDTLEQEIHERTGNSSTDSYKQLLVHQIRTWTDACDKLHGSACQPTPTETRDDHEKPLWLVDLRDRCLVAGHKADRYVALSYVWPKPDVGKHKLLTANEGTYQQPGSLSDMTEMPVAIRDCIELLQALGERYLWVDRLCIVQDGPKTGVLASSMNWIYSGSHFTVIAANKDGLFKSAAQDRGESLFDFTTMRNDYRDHFKETYYDILLRSPWGSRGWTFQEQLLSKRTVMFLGEQARDFRWTGEGSCSDMVIWDYCLAPDKDHSRYQADHVLSYQLKSERWPDFGTYLYCICVYNQRDLTSPQDALRAISGVLERIGGSFPGGFVSGLPRAFIDEALMWQPHTKAERRQCNKEALIPLPSWSWCGWKCAIDPLSLRTALYYSTYYKDKQRTLSWKMVPCVTWSILSNDRSSKETMNEAGLISRSREALQHNGIETLPSGWHTFPDHSCRQAYEHEKGLRYYYHISNPDQHFAYPLLTLEHLYKHVPQASEAFISGMTTTCCNLLVRKTLECCLKKCFLPIMSKPAAPKISVFDLPQFTRPQTVEEACSIMSLEDEKHNWAGVIRVMDEYVPAKGELADLVAISEGQVSTWDLNSSFEEKVDYTHRLYDNDGALATTWLEWGVKSAQVSSETEADANVYSDSSIGKNTIDEQDLTRPLHRLDREDIYHFYNVILVGYKDGIAYRKGAGRICKEVWEKHCSEPHEVILG